MELNLTSQILFISSFLGLLSVAILISHNRVRSYHIEPLIISLAAMTFWVFHRMLLHTDLILEVPHLYRTSAPAAMLITPMAYLYIRALVKNETKWRKADFVHFLPAIVFFGLLLPFFLKNTSEKRVWLEKLYADPALFGQFLEGGLPSYMPYFIGGSINLIYVTVAFLLLVNYLRKTPEKERFIPRKTINWLLFYLLTISVLSLVSLLAFSFHWSSDVYHYSTLNVFVGTFNFAVFILLFFHPAILYGVSNREYKKIKKCLTESDPGNPYGLSSQQIEEIKDEVLRHLEAERSFMDQNFSLSQLANEIDVPRHHLSYAINKGFGTNFSDLINCIRVEYCLREISDEEWETLTIEGVGNMLGFGNRGTFSRAFKKVTGKSPSEYRREKLA